MIPTLLTLLALAACAGGPAAGPAAEPTPAVPAPVPAPVAAPEEPMSGAVSPAGDPHPGSILYVDRPGAREWTEPAASVPQTVAWASIEGAWVPVVKVVLDGTAARREIHRYGPDDRFLDVTVSAPPRPPPPKPPTGE